MLALARNQWMTNRAGPAMSQEHADSPKAAVPADAETRSLSEASAPMLDVHAPYENVHTWKDFFIHIATITIGLLIAISLEQTVESIHHRHQAVEMADKLRAESLANRRAVEFDIANCNYWGVDAIQGSIVFTSQESWNSRVQLDALLNMRAIKQIASPQERDALLLALSNYREQQIRLRGQMAAFNTFNNAALAGKVLATDPGSIEQPGRTH